MNARRVNLLNHEEIVFESGPVVLTNQRVLANWKDANGGKPSDEAFLGNITKFDKINGGRESRVGPGLTIAAIGLVLVAVEAVAPDIHRALESVLFVAGVMGTVVGMYLVLTSLLQERPRTTILFEVLEGRPIPVTFPGWDNPEAEKLTRHFTRTKRRF